MESGSLIGAERLWYPLGFLGITKPYTAINVDTVIYTWITLVTIIALMFVARFFLRQDNSIGQYLVKSFIKSFTDLVEQSTGSFIYRYYTFIASLFLFIISCNWISLIPHVEEPTKDLNTTLALGIIAFLYAQKEVIKAHGIMAYLKDYFMPLNLIFPLNLITGLIMLPLKLLGELASIISISFRLFGNIFGGFIISSIYHKGISGSLWLNIAGTVSGINLIVTLFFVLFEGFLQAFVFSILSLTTIAMAVQTENEESHL
jgi:F-type H+-transporting ATPase subunit a